MWTPITTPDLGYEKQERKLVNKKPNAYRTISEAAHQVGVPAHVLRFWESRFSQISPMKKGGGRRYYRPDDIALLSGIRALLYDDGLSIKNVQALIKTNGIPAIMARAKEKPDTVAPDAAEEAVQSNAENHAAVEDSGEVHDSEKTETHERLSGALENLLKARAQLNETLQKH